VTKKLIREEVHGETADAEELMSQGVWVDENACVPGERKTR